jgi:hypothetical protein
MLLFNACGGKYFFQCARFYFFRAMSADCELFASDGVKIYIMAAAVPKQRASRMFYLFTELTVFHGAMFF